MFRTIPSISERVAEWLRRLTRKPKVRTAVASNPTLDSLVAVRNTSPGRPEPCEGNLVAVAGSCGVLMVKHPWPLLEISLSDIRGLAMLNINTYLPTYLILIYNIFETSHCQRISLIASLVGRVSVVSFEANSLVSFEKRNSKCHSENKFVASFTKSRMALKSTYLSVATIRYHIKRIWRYPSLEKNIKQRMSNTSKSNSQVASMPAQTHC